MHFCNRTIAARAGTQRRQPEAVYLCVEASAAAARGFSLDKRGQRRARAPLRSFSAGAKSGQLILAGRTSEPGDKTFGIAIFDAADEDAAGRLMEEDPAVAGGLMTAELHPFAVALQRKNP